MHRSINRSKSRKPTREGATVRFPLLNIRVRVTQSGGSSASRQYMSTLSVEHAVAPVPAYAEQRMKSVDADSVMFRYIRREESQGSQPIVEHWPRVAYRWFLDPQDVLPGRRYKLQSGKKVVLVRITGKEWPDSYRLMQEEGKALNPDRVYTHAQALRHLNDMRAKLIIMPTAAGWSPSYGQVVKHAV